MGKTSIKKPPTKIYIFSQNARGLKRHLRVYLNKHNLQKNYQFLHGLKRCVIYGRSYLTIDDRETLNLNKLFVKKKASIYQKNYQLKKLNNTIIKNREKQPTELIVILKNSLKQMLKNKERKSLKKSKFQKSVTYPV